MKPSKMNFVKISKIFAIVAAVLIIAGVVLGLTVGVAPTKSTHGYSVCYAELSVGAETEDVNLEELVAAVEDMVGGKAEVALETNMSTAAMVLTITNMPAAEVDTDAIASMILSDFSGAGETMEFKTLSVGPSIYGSDIAVYLVGFAFILIVAYLLLMVAYNHQKAFCALLSIVGMVVDALLIAALHVIGRLPAGGEMIVAMAAGMIASLAFGFLAINELAVGRDAAKSFGEEAANNTVAKVFSRNIVMIVIVLMVFAALIVCSVIFKSYGIVWYAVSILIGILVPLVTTVFLYPGIWFACSKK